jgi:regulator of replication initiation timing
MAMGINSMFSEYYKITSTIINQLAEENQKLKEENEKLKQGK